MNVRRVGAGSPKKDSGVKIDGRDLVSEMLSRMPEDVRATFTEVQIKHLRRVIKKEVSSHYIAIRGRVGFWFFRYYYAFFAGREKRQASRLEKELGLVMNAFVLLVFLLTLALTLLGAVYILKSALGIDLFPGFSVGGWQPVRDLF